MRYKNSNNAFSADGEEGAASFQEGGAGGIDIVQNYYDPIH